jgi:two-component system OmpR family sensor kinase
VKARWIAAVLPAAASLVGNVLMAAGVVANPVVLLETDLATAVLTVGLALSAVLVIVPYLRSWANSVRRQSILKSAQDRRRFLLRLDHELKNPLTALRAGLANLRETADDRAENETLAGLEAQTLRLSRLTADLGKLADLETRPIEGARIDLGELLKEALSLAQENPAAGTRELSLTLPRAPWPLSTVQGDRDLLLLAMHNLIDNAMKFTRPGDTIEVRAVEDGLSVVLEVADTGPGIPSAELPHVWDELYRGEGARGVPGSGLGLALVRTIAERHGGQVHIRTRAGEGTVVGLRLPAA